MALVSPDENGTPKVLKVVVNPSATAIKPDLILAFGSNTILLSSRAAAQHARLSQALFFLEHTMDFMTNARLLFRAIRLRL